MWLPIIANFVNIILIIFGCFGAVQLITRYLIAYIIWSCMWLMWNVFLICYHLSLGNLNRESGLLSLGTGSVSWWEGNGWGCQPVWAEVEGPGSWRPTRVEGCLLYWPHVELGQSVIATLLTLTVLPLTILCARRSYKTAKSKENKTIHPVFTIELSPPENIVSENSLKPMTPRRVKRRSGSRGTNSSVRRSRRSYRNAGYMASTGSLSRESRTSRPTSAHSSYSNFHGTRPASYHVPESKETYLAAPPPSESVPTLSGGYEGRSCLSVGYDVVGPYKEPVRVYEQGAGYENTHGYDDCNRGYSGYETRMDMVISPCDYDEGREWPAPPPPAPPYAARATPQAPGPPAYQVSEHYNMP